MMDLLDSLNLNNPYVLYSLFAFVSFALGFAGMMLGQRASGNGKLCILVGLGLGLGTMALLATSAAYLAPGWCVVFVFSFLLSNQLTKLACSRGK